MFKIIILPETAQNNTIEERVSLLEIQVADLREDVTEVDEDVTGLDEDINFLFDEQVIQDERLFSLEQTSLQVAVELAELNANILGRYISLIFHPLCTKIFHLIFLS